MFHIYINTSILPIVTLFFLARPINQVNAEFNAIEYIQYECYHLLLHSEANYVCEIVRHEV